MTDTKHADPSYPADRQAEMPEEPKFLYVPESHCGKTIIVRYVEKIYYDSLRAHLARVTVERNEAKEAQARAEKNLKLTDDAWNRSENEKVDLMRKLAECEKDRDVLWCNAIIATQDGPSGRMICDVEKLLHEFTSKRPDAIAKEFGNE